MIQYKITPEGSEKWIPKDWENWYKQFRQKTEELPQTLAKLMHKGLEYIRRIIVTEYLTKVTPKGGSTIDPHGGQLHVRTGRLRASINYRVTLINKLGVTGEIGTDVWYGKIHEEGGTYGAPPSQKTFPPRPWLKPAVTSPAAYNYMNSLFSKLGMYLQEVK